MPGRARLRYRLSVADAAARHLEVEFAAEGPFEGPVRLWMASWVPGSYLLREYAGHVISLRAFADEAPVAAPKVDKHTWEIPAGGAAALRVVYRVYAPELTVRTNDVDDQHAFVNPAGTFLALQGREEEPCELEVAPPPGWRVHVALPETGRDRWAVADFDTLVDSPLELGPMPVHSFEACGVRHDLVIQGEGNYEVDRMLEDMRKVVEAEAALFGGLPEDLDRYLFILLLGESGMGGLEHKHSTALAWPRLGFRPEEEYHKFLTLVAHEYFHVWNVKRLRPEIFLRYDYRREMYTRLLWAFEGVTNYYDELLPCRAGVYPVKRYLGFTAENIRSEWSRPGSAVQSVADSSFDTWIKLYRPNPDSWNSQVSYYQRGMLVALLLDLHLRRTTGDERSLDDVMRHLWTEVHGRGRGIPEDGYAALVREATGVDVDAWLREHIEGTGSLDYEAGFAHVGLRLLPKPAKEDEPRPAWLGANVQTREGLSVLSTVLVGGSAHQAGLMAGDELLALGGMKVGTALTDRLKQIRDGETLGWTAFRSGRLVEGEITFLPDPHPPQRLVPLETVSERQKASFTRWTGAPWDLPTAD